MSRLLFLNKESLIRSSKLLGRLLKLSKSCRKSLMQCRHRLQICTVGVQSKTSASHSYFKSPFSSSTAIASRFQQDLFPQRRPNQIFSIYSKLSQATLKSRFGTWLRLRPRDKAIAIWRMTFPCWRQMWHCPGWVTTKAAQSTHRKQFLTHRLIYLWFGVILTWVREQAWYCQRWLIYRLWYLWILSYH